MEKLKNHVNTVGKSEDMTVQLVEELRPQVMETTDAPVSHVRIDVPVPHIMKVKETF